MRSTFFRITSGAAAVAATAGVVAATLAPAPPAAAATRCTAWGAMPARVALHSEKTVVKIVLRGTSGCRNQRTDNGASAWLVYPSGSREDQRWRHFGAAQSVALYVNIVKSGRFDLRHGDVQVYNAKYERVSWSWRATTMVVRRAARIVHLSVGGGIVAGRALVYTKYGWAGHSDVPVVVQRRRVNSSTWRTLGSMRPAAGGRFRFATATSSRFVYRVIQRATTNAWNANSVQVRG